jgi:membrane-associated protein
MLADLLLEWVVTYGPAVLAVMVFLGAAGLPLPCTVLVAAGGALVQQGVWDPLSALALALLGGVVGDGLGYTVGRFGCVGVRARFGNRRRWRQAKWALARWGGVGVFLTRWLLTPLGGVTNWAAGCGGFPYPQFFAFGMVGKLLWLLIFGGLGYLFSDRWEAVVGFAGRPGGVLAVIVILALGVYLLLQRWRLAAALLRLPYGSE